MRLLSQGAALQKFSWVTEAYAAHRLAAPLPGQTLMLRSHDEHQSSWPGARLLDENTGASRSPAASSLLSWNKRRHKADASSLNVSCFAKAHSDGLSTDSTQPARHDGVCTSTPRQPLCRGLRTLFEASILDYLTMGHWSKTGFRHYIQSCGIACLPATEIGPT